MQGLNNDLNALRLMHPYIIDTSVIFNITGVRWRKSKLSLLSKVSIFSLYPNYLTNCVIV